VWNEKYGRDTEAFPLTAEEISAQALIDAACAAAVASNARGSVHYLCTATSAEAAARSASSGPIR
jgi:hypothetical protein